MNVNSYSCCSPSSSKSKQISSLLSILKLVSEENRLQLLCILQQGTHCVCELMEHTKSSQSLISHHLKDLREAGIVKDNKQGLRVYYSLTKKGKLLTNALFQIPQGVEV